MRRRVAAALAAALMVAACSGGGSGGASSGSSGATTARPTTTAGTATTTTTTSAVAGAAGAEGAGDPYFPDLGNGGYDVEHYDLDLKVAADGSIDARAEITATATQDLSSFDLDLSGLDVSAVTVDGSAAEVERHDRELVVRPGTPLRTGARFDALVAYGGKPEPVDTVVVGGIQVGWQRTGDGSFVMSEPEGARTWFPANDHPSDKATFTIHVTPPPGLDAVANGVLTGTEQTPSGTRSTFAVDAPMATYLATVVIGHLDVRTSAGPAGVTIRDVYPAGEGDDQAQYFGDQAAMLSFFADRFGPYPFPVYGALVTDGLHGLDFEAQTMSLFGPGPAPEIVAHELAHQWFGDSLTPARWRDIWLNEGFATFGEWLWLEHLGVATTAQSAARAVASGPGPIRDPGVRAMFDDPVYSRGGATLEALRETIGDSAFYDVLRTYASRFAGKTVTTDDFVAVAQEVSGRDLGALFAAWLDAPSPPALPG